MKTTETSTSLLPPCLLLNPALTAVQSLQQPPYAQVKTLSFWLPPLTASFCALFHLTSSFYLLRKWGVSGAWLRAQQQVPGGVSIPYFPASFPAEEGPGHPVEH